MSKESKKVLFTNPASEQCGVPHYGLAMLSAVLRQQGHEVRVADYYYSQDVPPLAEILDAFQPDVIGVSALSARWRVADECIDQIRERDTEIPIICGGPHVSCYHDDLIKDSRIDYVVIGEAETVITDLVEKAVRQDSPQLVRPPLPDVRALPLPDYTSFYDYERISVYPLVTSRGCPYGCSFCAVAVTNSRKWRAREIKSCIEELDRLGEQFPKVKEVVVWDDNFTLDLNRGKQLVKEYLASGLSYPLRPANMRADRVDEELVQLLKSAGCEIIQLGAEHGDQEVFSAIGKGETLEDIRRAGKIAKENGMRLILSFIVGLPGDSLKKTLASVRLARELGADRCYWNILVPYRGTRSYDYFKALGRLEESRVPATWARSGDEEWPTADTPDFPAAERMKAKRIAEILTEELSPRGNLGGVTLNALRYGFVKDWGKLLLRKISRRLSRSGW